MKRCYRLPAWFKLLPHHIDQDIEDSNYGQIGSFDFINENIFFDIHGTILNPTGALFRYKWGASRVAELLPIDYLPPIREEKARKLMVSF